MTKEQRLCMKRMECGQMTDLEAATVLNISIEDAQKLYILQNKRTKLKKKLKEAILTLDLDAIISLFSH